MSVCKMGKGGVELHVSYLLLATGCVQSVNKPLTEICCQVAMIDIFTHHGTKYRNRTCGSIELERETQRKASYKVLYCSFRW